MKLRDPYQLECVAGTHARFAESSEPTMGVLATGGGKTIIAAHVIADRPTGRAMMIAHRAELIWQAADKIKAVTGEAVGIEMAEWRADAEPMFTPRVVVSTVQTQYAGQGGEGRMKNFDPMEFDTLIVDECHHFISPAFRRVIDHYMRNPNIRVLGITATPDRSDGKAMGQVFKSVAFDFGIRYMVDEGWLCPIDQQMIPAPEVDLSDVRTSGDDFAAVQLAEKMEEEGPLHAIAKPTLELCGERRALVFAASVKHAQLLTDIFNAARLGSAQCVSEKTPSDVRREMFANYRAGRFQYLVNVGIACEGFDDPGVEVVVMGRPTKSRALYAQCIGRGTRALPGIVDRWDDADDRRVAIAESEKPACLVLDFVGNSGKHKLVTVADILGGDFDPVAVERAKQKAAEDGTPTDMLEELKAAAAALHAEREAEREREARRWADARNSVKVSYTTEAVDPFDVFKIRPARDMGWDTREKPTEKMIAYLEKRGPKNVDFAGLSKGQAGAMISEINRRSEANLCTARQAEQLNKRGLPTEVSFDQAREWMDAIATNNWRLPNDLAAVAAKHKAERAAAAPAPAADVDFFGSEAA